MNKPLIKYLWEQKLWWIVPMAAVLGFFWLVFAFIPTPGSAAGPLF